MRAEKEAADLAMQKIAAADHAQAMLQCYAVLAEKAATQKEEAVTAAYEAQQSLSAMKVKLVETDRLDVLESCTVHVDAAAQSFEVADHSLEEDCAEPEGADEEMQTCPGLESACSAAEVEIVSEAAQADSQRQGEEDLETYPGMESAVSTAFDEETALEAGARGLQMGEGEDMSTYPGLESVDCTAPDEEAALEASGGDSQHEDDRDMETYPGLEPLNYPSANGESALQAPSDSQLTAAESRATYPGMESLHCLTAEEEVGQEDRSSDGDTGSGSAEGEASPADRIEQSNSTAAEVHHAVPTAGEDPPPPAAHRTLEREVEAATPLTFAQGLPASFCSDFDTDGIFIFPKSGAAIRQEDKIGNDGKEAPKGRRSLVRGDSAFNAPEALQPKQADTGKLATIW